MEQFKLTLDQLEEQQGQTRMQELEALIAGRVPRADRDPLLKELLELQEDARQAVADTARANMPAITSHFRSRENQSILTVVVLNLAVLLAWTSKRTSQRRFMLQHFMQRLPPSSPAPYTLLTSAFSYPGPRGWGDLWITLVALKFGGQMAAHILGPFGFLAFYLSASAASSLSGHFWHIARGSRAPRARLVASGPAGALCAIFAFLACRYESWHINAPFAGLLQLGGQEQQAQQQPHHPDSAITLRLPFSDKHMVIASDISSIATGPYAVLAGAMLFSMAGLVRQRPTYQHAHHLGGLLFGSAYAQLTMPNRRSNVQPASPDTKPE